MKRSNRTLRSVLSLLLAVAMCLTLALPALAAGGETTFDGVYRLVNAVNADQRVARATTAFRQTTDFTFGNRRQGATLRSPCSS